MQKEVCFSLELRSCHVAKSYHHRQNAQEATSVAKKHKLNSQCFRFANVPVELDYQMVPSPTAGMERLDSALPSIVKVRPPTSSLDKLLALCHAIVCLEDDSFLDGEYSG